MLDMRYPRTGWMIFYLYLRTSGIDDSSWLVVPGPHWDVDPREYLLRL